MSKPFGRIALIALVLGTADAARADITYYSDLSSFLAASTATTTVEFDGIAPADGSSPYGAGGSVTLSGVTFSTAPTTDLSIRSASYYAATFGTPYNLGAGDYLQAGNHAPASLHIALPVGVTSVSFLVSTFDFPGSGVAITAQTGKILTAVAPAGPPAFIGFTSTDPITSLDIVIGAGDRQDTLSIDSFRFGFGLAQAVPEPSSLILCGLGSVGIAGLARRQRRDRAGR
jgi:hypothetical protein